MTRLADVQVAHGASHYPPPARARRARPPEHQHILTPSDGFDQAPVAFAKSDHPCLFCPLSMVNTPYNYTIE